MTPDTTPAKADASAVEVLREVNDKAALCPCCGGRRMLAYNNWMRWQKGLPEAPTALEHTSDCHLAAALQSSSSAEAELRAALQREIDAQITICAERDQYREAMLASEAERNTALTAITDARQVLAEAGISMSFLDDGVKALVAERDALRAENEQNKHLVQLLRADLARFLNAGDVPLCEGCDAPIDHDEEASTVSDVRGCWGFVSDDKKSPCYRYRTEKGADRAWPICTALNHGKGEDARAAVTKDQGGEHDQR